MAKIQVLDVQTANRIAAGEVVERPASVAKELLENALDAGATAVTLEIREGGIAYLRVTDNGAGIAPEDCRLAFERHATSKIRSGDDLAHIGTLGFRGEALPSIAAVSRVELTTRTEEAAAGVRLQVEAGRFLDVREAGCPKGTTFVVRDLFFNTPARAASSSSAPATEAGYVADVAAELALSRPEIAVRFVNNGKVVFQTVGNGDLRSAIYVLHGREVASEALPFSYAQGAVRASGFVGVGNLARSIGKGQRLGGDLPAVEHIDGGAQVPVAHGLEDHLAVVDEAHGDLRPGERQLRRHVRHVPGLRGRALEELAARGGVEEQVAHDEGRALGAAGFAHVEEAPRLDLQADARGGLFCPGGQLHAGDRGDGGQRLPAEAQGADVRQVVPERILEVACRSKARRQSSGAMPAPLSVTRR